MTNADRILRVLKEAAGPVCDDCVSERAHVFPRQQVNQLAARLADAGRVVRGKGANCTYCGRDKKVSQTAGENRGLESISAKARAPRAISSPPPPEGANTTRAWHWEGNIQMELRQYLEREGWVITASARTETKEAGVDLAAERGKRELMVEVKGFPTTTYEHGEKRGLPKPTPPSSQARQWYSHALRTVMTLRDKHPHAEVALCFPDFPTYRTLIDGTRISLGLVRVGVYLIAEDGVTSVYLPH